jgi:hypothetical protein
VKETSLDGVKPLNQLNKIWAVLVFTGTAFSFFIKIPDALRQALAAHFKKNREAVPLIIINA